MGKKKPKPRDTLRGLGGEPRTTTPAHAGRTVKRASRPSSESPPAFTLSEPGMPTDPRLPKRATLSRRGASPAPAVRGSRPRSSAATHPRSSRITLASVPAIARTSRELVKLPLDHRAGFILSLVDGSRDVDWIIDAAGIGAAEVIIELEKLILLGAITV